MILAFIALGSPIGLAAGAESEIDFEGLSADLPGWNAVAPGADRQPEYRLAAKWDEPFRFSLDGENPHSGSLSLKCEFTAEVAGDFNFGPAALVGSGVVEVRFFVRSQGFLDEGTVSFGEYDDGGKRVPSAWAGTKIPLSEEWQEVVWSGRLKPETAGVRMRFAFKSVPAGAKIWIDDISVKTVEN